MRGFSIESAFTIMQKQRPCLWPNETLLKHFDKLLDLKGELVSFDKKWKQEQLSKDRLGIIAFGQGTDDDGQNA